MNRRAFMRSCLFGLGGFSLLSNIISFDSSSKKNRYFKKGKVAFVLGEYGSNQSSALRIFDWDHFNFLDIPLGKASPHSIVRSKTNENEIFLFELFGVTEKINIADGSRVTVNSSQNRVSYGHGIQSRDGKALICTNIDRVSFSSEICIRDINTLQIIGKAPKEIGNHHLVQMPFSSIIASGSALGPYGQDLYFYDYEKNIVVQKIPLQLGVAHLTAISSSEIIGVGTRARLPQYKMKSKDMNPFSTLIPEPAPLFKASTSGSFQLFWDENRKELFNSGFSVVPVPSNGIWISSFGELSNVVIIWKDFKILKIIPAQIARGIVVSKDEKEFMVHSRGEVLIYSMENFALLHRLKYEKPIISLAAY